MKKVRQSTIGLLFVCLLLLSSKAAMAADTVPVRIPEFAVTLNDVQVEQIHREYPFLVYNNITYFPMTYYDCRFLGLESVWTEQEGFSITKADISGGYRAYWQAASNDRRTEYQAEKIAKPVLVNGTVIDNKTEQYPLLRFRNVVYFPLTWRFAVETFGWDYQFDDKAGFTIRSDNLAAKPLAVQNGYYGHEQGFYQGHFQVMKDQLLYLTNDYYLYRMPLNQLQPAQEIQLTEKGHIDSGPVFGAYVNDPGRNVQIYKAFDGQYYFYCCNGWGNIMGIFSEWLIHDDYTINGNEARGGIAGIYQHYPDVDICIDVSILDVRDKDKYHNYGRGDYYFDYREPQQYQLIGRNLYIMASKELFGWGKLCCIDLDTGKITEILPEPVDWFQIIGNIAYVVNKQNQLLAVNLANGAVEALSITLWQRDANNPDVSLSCPICAVGKRLYYVKNDRKLYCLGNDTPLENANVTNLLDVDEHLVVCFEAKPENPCRFLVLDSAGNCIYRSADVVSAVSIDGDNMVYQSGKQLYLVKL